MPIMRHTPGAADVFVELRVCCLHIRRDPKRADAEAQGTHDDPAEEAQIQHELFPLVAVHQLAALIDAGLPAVVGVVELDIIGHGIGIHLDDAGDDEQQRPQESKERRHEADEERPAEIILEAAEHVAQLHRLVIPRLLEENKGHAVFQRPDHDQCADAGQDPRGCRFHQADQQAHRQPHHPQVLEDPAAELRPRPGF